MINAPVDADAEQDSVPADAQGPAVAGNQAPPQVIDGLSIYNLSIYLGLTYVF